MSDENQESASSNQSENNSSSGQQQNPPLRDTNTYLEKGEKSGTTRKD